MKSVRFILASASPARLATLRRAGVEPEVIVSGFDEESVQADTPFQLAMSLARFKAFAVRAKVSGRALVLGCDSVLEFEGEAMGKPASVEVAKRRWQRLRGNTGSLYTGHCLTDGNLVTLATVETKVLFEPVTDDEIDEYCATGEPLAVAGGFTIDGLGSWFVTGVTGDPHNVVGLSLPTLRHMLHELNYTLADLGYPHR